MTKRISTKQLLTAWDKATQDLAIRFVKRYFDSRNFDWVGGRIGDILCVGDYFFNISRVIEAFELKATQKQILEYYDYELEMGMRGQSVEYNFTNYVKYFSGFGYDNK